METSLCFRTFTDQVSFALGHNDSFWSMKGWGKRECFAGRSFTECSPFCFFFRVSRASGGRGRLMRLTEQGVPHIREAMDQGVERELNGHFFSLNRNKLEDTITRTTHKGKYQFQYGMYI